MSLDRSIRFWCFLMAGTLAGCMMSQASADVTTGLVGHWKLNETSGTTAADSSANANHGIFAGTPMLGTAAPCNLGANFTADGNYVAAPASTSLNAIGASNSDFSVAFWVSPGTPPGNWRPLFHKGAGDFERGPGIWLQPGENRLHCKVSTSANNNEGPDSVAVLPAAVWSHVACVKEGNQWRIYVNGTLDTVFTLAGTTSGNVGPVYIGDDPWYAGSYAQMDDVRIYNRALTAVDVGELWAPRLHWKLNETNGTIAADSSTCENTGTVTGTVSWIAGRRANGFDFNGSTKIDATSTCNNPASFTLAGWVRADTLDTSGGEVISIGDYAVLRLTATTLVSRIYIGSSTYHSVTYNTALVGTGWRHVAATFDDTANSFKLYVDGALVATATETSSITWTGLGTKTVIASHGNSSTAYDLDGAIDDARVYSRALSLSEVVELYGLIGHWKLDEANGTAAADSSGIGNNGTHTSGPVAAQTGIRSRAVQFDGTDDYTAAGSGSSLKVTESVTMSAWVKPTASANATRMIINKEGEYELGLTSAGVVQWALANTTPGWAWHTTTATVPNGKWSHIVVTYDQGTAKTYVDGVLKETFTGAGNIGDSHPSLNELRIAARSNSPTNQYLGGLVDDVRVYNRALTLSEVVELYGFIGHWTFDEGTGTTIADSTGMDNDAAFQTGTPTWIDGVRGKALYFNGTNDARTTAAVDPPAEGTVTFWMKSDGPPVSRQRSWGLGADYEMWQDPDGLLSCDLSTDGFQGGFITTTPLHTPSRWYHVAAVYNSDDDSYKIYIDGQLHKSGTSTFAMVKKTAAQLSFGTRTGATERFIGALDDFRIYNRQLSAQEITELYGLVGHWNFDEGTGTTAADSSGGGNNAIISGAAWTSDCVANTALEFDGVNDTAATVANFTPPATGAVAFWMRGSGTPAVQQRLFGINGEWEARIAPTGIISFDLGASPFVGNEPFATPVVDELDRWYHVVAMFNDTNDAYQVYINGELTASGTSPVNLIAQSNGILTFGTRTGNPEYWQGALRDFRIYDRWMLPNEIQQTSGIIARWQLNELSGTAAADSSIAGNNATYIGSPTLGATGSNTANNNAVELNGTSQYVTSGKSLLNGLSKFSMMAWIRADNITPDKSFFGQAGLVELGIDTSSDQLDLWTSSGGSLSANTQLPISKWSHVAAVGDGYGLKIYFNGVEVASGGSVTATYGSNSGIFKIGEGVLTASGNYFDGRFDDVRVYSRALCPSEIAAIYQGGRPAGIRIIQWVETR